MNPLCPKCGISKIKENTHNNHKNKWGLAPYCKACTRLYENSRKEHRRVLENKYYKNNRRAVLAAYGNKCVCCGETEPLFLEIDHINGGGTKERRANKDVEGFYRRLLREHPPEFQILCSNCNRGRWLNKGLCPHKTRGLNGSNKTG